MAEVAVFLGLCESYCSSLFSSSVGIPFRSYLNRLRMEKAQDLLMDPRLRISDVAFAVGHQDPNSFRQAFEKYTGLSPSVWRETPSVP